MKVSSEDRPITHVLQDIVNHVREIFRSEVLLARTEIRSDAIKATKAGLFLIIGGLLALYTLGLLLLGAVYGLGTQIAPWLSALIVAIAVGVVAAIFLVVGRARMKRASLKPETTIRSLQENVTWMKKQAK